jgi:hypothetical protein
MRRRRDIMNAKETRQYEMLLRVRDFGNTHRELFAGSSVAQQAFAAVGRTIDDLTATDMRKMSASISARAERKGAAREALTEVLLKVSQLVKVLRARGQTTPPFELPESRSDQALLTAGRQFARDAAALEAEFTGHGMAPTHIAGITAAFEEATRDLGMSRADHTAARTRIQELLSSALLEVRRLDLIIDNELAGDKVIEAVWKQVRRVDDPRRPRTTGEPEPPAPATGVDAAAPQPA